MSTLYEITGNYLTLLDYADDTDPQVFEDTLESIKGEIQLKADDYVAVIKEINGNIDKFDAEIKRLTARKKTMENSVKRMKQALLEAMTAMNIPEIKTDKFRMFIKKNGGQQALTITGDVPDNYQRIVYEVDTDKIRKDLKDGKELGFAHLQERGSHVEIR